MPNWCDHDLSVTGPKAERDRFLAAITVPVEALAAQSKAEYEQYLVNAKANGWDITPPPATPTEPEYRMIAKLLPIPDDIASTTSPNRDVQSAAAMLAKYGVRDWYDWQTRNWGCKWGDCHTGLMCSDERQTSLRFDVPWGPALPAYSGISALFPTLTFYYRYYEQGMGFSGRNRYVGGRCIEETVNNGYRGGRGG